MEENKPFNNKEEVKQPNIEQQLNNSSTDEVIVPAIDTEILLKEFLMAGY